jgi:serine/threonine-protein kinase
LQSGGRGCDVTQTLTGPPGASRAPLLTALDEAVGPVPRVLLRDTPTDDPKPVRPRSEEMPDLSSDPGRYQLLGEIGRGGMGAVLKGRDVDLGRDLAVKVLLEKHRDHPEMAHRFIEEAQIGGQLQHPGVVPVYELGQFPDRRLYFAMKLVKGRTLAALLEARKDPADDRPRFLSIFEQVCQTVGYAHARGVIHRDLKPSNVMVGSFGEVQVMDWGLAKVLGQGGAADDQKTRRGHDESIIRTVRTGSDAGASRAGSVLGTPSYMAPEQARGEIDRLDERADVFGLGSILCEILTGHPAYTGRAGDEVHRKAAAGDLADAVARLDACGADGELVGLARRCLAAEPKDRPRDAGVVAAALTAHLQGVQQRLQAAERESAVAVARALEERRRRKLQLGLAASVLALTTLGGLGATYYLQQRQARAAAVDRVLARAATLRDEARANPDDPARWRVAMAAVQQAEGALGNESEARRRLAALRDEVQAGADAVDRDRVLHDRLVDIRSAKADDPDGSATDAAYADAFREAGLDLATLAPAEAGAKIKARPPAVALALAAALDDWAAVRRGLRNDVTGAARLTPVALAADPDPWRNDLRVALDQPDKSARLTALQALAKTTRFDELGAVSLDLLGSALMKAGDATAAEAVLRAAQRRYPGDVWVNYDLAGVLEKLSRRDEAIRYYTAARSIRPETAHELAHALQDKGEFDEAIAAFRDLARLRPKVSRHQICLGGALKERGFAEEADGPLRRGIDAARAAIRLKPDVAVTHYNLGNALRAHGKPAAAIDEYRAAIALKPDYAAAHSNLGVALRDQGNLEQAIAAFRQAIGLQPDDAKTYNNLGLALRDQGRLEEAVVAYRSAIRIKPELAGGHNNLAWALTDLGRLQEAIAELREAIRLKPDFAWAHANLGKALAMLGDDEGAIGAFRTAIRLKPDHAEAHTNLGASLGRQGKVDEAVAEHRTAIRLRPDLALAHTNLGAVLCNGKRDYPAAEAAFREAIRLRPDLALAHTNLGVALAAQGRPDEAVAEYRAAIRLQPDHPETHCNLGHLFWRQGDYAGTLAMYRRGHELGIRRPGWPYPSARWVADAERMVALAARLPTLLKGESRPKDAAERLTLAQMCYDTKRHAAAARFWAEALAADPKLGDDRQAQIRYNAACAAAQAAAGQGTNDTKPDDAARAKLRGQALDWLKAERAVWANALDSGDVQAGPVVRRTLEHWQADPDLAGVRDTDALAKLPEAERGAWRSLWAEVDALLARVRGGRP